MKPFCKKITAIFVVVLVCSLLFSLIYLMQSDYGKGVIGTRRKLQAGGVISLSGEPTSRDLQRFLTVVTNFGFVLCQANDDALRFVGSYSVANKSINIHILLKSSPIGSDQKTAQIRWIVKTDSMVITEDVWDVWNDFLCEIRQLFNQEEKRIYTSPGDLY